MLRTKHNEVVAALYGSDIAYLRQHLFCSKFHSIKIRECHKKRGMTSSTFIFSENDEEVCG